MIDCFCGAKGDVPCVCQTELELADTPDTGEIDSRFLLTPRDVRDEYRHAEDFNGADWWDKP